MANRDFFHKILLKIGTSSVYFDLKSGLFPKNQAVFRDFFRFYFPYIRLTLSSK